LRQRSVLATPNAGILYVQNCDLYVSEIEWETEDLAMGASKQRTVHKNFRLDPSQIARAQKALGAATETETIVRALDHVISEAERNLLTIEANRRFLKSGIVIEDLFGSLSQ
jgi:hypothetical protein